MDNDKDDMPKWLKRMPGWLFFLMLAGIVAVFAGFAWFFGFMMTLAWLFLLVTLWGTAALWFHEMGFAGNALLGPVLALVLGALGTIFVHSMYQPLEPVLCDAGEQLDVENRYKKVHDRGRIKKDAVNLSAYPQCINSKGEAEYVGFAATYLLPALFFYLCHLAFAGVGQLIAKKTKVGARVSFTIALCLSILFALLP